MAAPPADELSLKRCPGCSYLVPVAWNVCRRCGKTISVVVPPIVPGPEPAAARLGQLDSAAPVAAAVSAGAADGSPGRCCAGGRAPAAPTFGGTPVSCVDPEGGRRRCTACNAVALADWEVCRRCGTHIGVVAKEQAGARRPVPAPPRLRTMAPVAARAAGERLHTSQCGAGRAAEARPRRLAAVGHDLRCTRSRAEDSVGACGAPVRNRAVWVPSSPARSRWSPSSRGRFSSATRVVAVPNASRRRRPRSHRRNNRRSPRSRPACPRRTRQHCNPRRACCRQSSNRHRRMRARFSSRRSTQHAWISARDGSFASVTTASLAAAYPAAQFVGSDQPSAAAGVVSVRVISPQSLALSTLTADGSCQSVLAGQSDIQVFLSPPPCAAAGVVDNVGAAPVE